MKILALSKGSETVVLTGATNSNTTISSLPTDIRTSLYKGMIVTGTGIAADTIIASVNSATEITLSRAATASATVALTFSKVNYDVPTNPHFVTVNGGNDTNVNISASRLLTVIQPDFEFAPATDVNTFTAMGGFTLTGCSYALGGTVITTTGNTNNLYIGCSIKRNTGVDIPDNTVVTEILSSTTFRVSNIITSAGSSITIVCGMQHSNLANTKGFRIKSFDNTIQKGVQLTGTEWNLGKYYYFVLVYSDDYLQHHMAKITEVIDEDTTGDAFEFEPKLGSEIPRDTKYQIWRLPIPTTNHPVAVSAGLKNTIEDDMVCARPLFYFFNDYLDNNNELNHNTRYNVKHDMCLATTNTFVGGDQTPILTSQDYSNSIIDYSKHSLRVKMVDNLRILDNPTTNNGAGTCNEGLPLTAFNLDANNSCFPNSRRDATGLISAAHAAPQDSAAYRQITGPTRYLHYNFSPTKSNFTPNVFDAHIYESTGRRGSFAETKIADTFRMMPKKLKTFTAYRARHRLHQSGFNEWVALNAKVKANVSGNEYTFNIDFDLGTFFNVGDEVKVGSRILIVNTIDALTHNQQDVTFETYNRIESESIFNTSSYTLTADDIIYRRAWNNTDGTLLTDFNFIDSRFTNLYVKFISSDFGLLEATVTAANKDTRLLTLSFDSQSYLSSTAATATITVADGDADCGMTEKEFITIQSTDGTEKKYVLVDSRITSVTTGTVLASDSDTGVSTAGSAYRGDLTGGIAVALSLTSSFSTQNDFLVELKAAIEHANGHNGKITVSAVPTEANGNQAITLTQAVAGHGGNQTITDDISQTTIAGFTGGTSITALDYLSGSYIIEVERFNGEIEKIDSYKEHGQTIMELSGRSNFSKLISPIINKNARFSQDIIYSSNSPFQKITSLGTFVYGYFDSTTVSFRTKNTNDASGGSDAAMQPVVNGVDYDPVAGDKIFFKYDDGTISYSGEVASYDDSAKTVTLTQNSRSEATFYFGRPTAYYVPANTKNYIFNKALNSNMFVDSATSLTGASGRGVFFESGYELASSGAESTDLVGSSEVAVADAVGYYVSDTNQIKSEYAFQTRLGDNASTKTYSSFDTINTLIDFTILNVSKENNSTTVEVAPYLPLTLGRVDVNYANTQDTTFSTTTLGTLSNHDGGGSPILRYANVSVIDGSEVLSSISDPRKYHGKPVYVGSTFQGYLRQAVLDNDHATIQIFLDREWDGTSTGEVNVLEYTNGPGTSTYSESSKLTHELNFLNGAHLHGGKIISLISPTVMATKDRICTFDYPIHYSYSYANSTSQPWTYSYSEKYGSPYYRIINMEKGEYNQTTHTNTRTNTSESDSKYYANISSKIPYYASAYRFKPGFTVNSIGSSGTTDTPIVGVGKTGSTSGLKGTQVAENHMLIESRGWKPPIGSRYFDSTLVYSADTLSPEPVLFTPDASEVGTTTADHASPYGVIDKFDLIDPKIARMFLFANSDLLPYSSTRYDSLMYSGQTRTINKYNLFSLVESTATTTSETKSVSFGKSASAITKDSSYSSAAIIESDKTINSLKRFSIMRLTELVFDWHFNQFDPENIPSKDTVLSKFTYKSYDLSATSCISVLADPENYNGSTLRNVVANPASDFTAGDAIADSKGRFIGRFASSAIGSPSDSGKYTITFAAVPYKTDGNAYYYGTLHKAPVLDVVTNANVITGHGKQDTFVILDNDIHMLRSAVMREATSITRDGTTNSNTTVNSLPSDINDLPLYAGMHVTGTGIASNTTILTIDSATAITLSKPATASATVALTFSRSYGEVGSAFNDKYGTILQHPDTHAESRPNLWLPVAFDSGGNAESLGRADAADTNHPSLVFKMIDSFQAAENNTTATAASRGYKNMLPVFLDRFGIENGGGSKVTKGTAAPPIQGASIRDIGNFSLVGMNLLEDYSRFEGPSGGTKAYDEDADGVMMGLKLRLKVSNLSEVVGGNTASGVEKTVGNKTVYTYLFQQVYQDFGTGPLRFANDLTGCYLVSELHTYVDADNAIGISAGTSEANQSINNGSPATIAYVISHEIDTSTGGTGVGDRHHRITLDQNISEVAYYRVMQPNHTCFYDFSPQTVALNVMSSNYTKVSGENRTYSNDSINDYLIKEGTGDKVVSGAANQGGSEAVLSMYVVADLDVQSSSTDTVVLRNQAEVDDLLSANTEYEMCVSDGENVNKTSIEYIADDTSVSGAFRYLKFGSHKEMIGVPSVSETMTLTVNGDISTDAKRAMIGSVVSVCSEAEDLIDELLEENDINYTLTKNTNYPLFVAPNYQGIDLFSAVNSLLEKKNKRLVDSGGSFTITDDDDSSHYSKIVLDDNGEYQIYEYEKTSSIFDYYNEIIVYGRHHKATRKDIKNIQKRGRKTLEVFERELLSQDEVDERALTLLKLHSDDNQKLTLTVGHKGISQIKTGDIIGVELLRENIPLRQYMVLQIEHLLTGNMKLELGRFSKQLEDRFAELALTNQRTNTQLREQNFDENSVSLDFLTDLNINETRLIVRKLGPQVGGFRLGFTATLNTGTTTLSTGLGLTVTDLLEEEY